MMRRSVENIVKGLQKGIKVSTVHGITRVPIPTASTLIFHRTKDEDGFVTLQAQTSILDDKITYEQVKQICDFSSNIIKINHEKFFIVTGKALSTIAVFFGVMMIPAPLIAASSAGLGGFIISIIIYLAIILLFNLIKFSGKKFFFNKFHY